MAINRRWALSLALMSGAAIGVALSHVRRKELRHVETRQLKQDMHAWEDEGGSLAETATTPHGS